MTAMGSYIQINIHCYSEGLNYTSTDNVSSHSGVHFGGSKCVTLGKAFWLFNVLGAGKCLYDKGNHDFYSCTDDFR